MKKLAIVGIILGFIVGISLIFIGTIMVDLKTQYQATAFMMGFLGFIICVISAFGILGVCGVLEL